MTIKIKNPDPIDCHVGSRVRLRRLVAGVSQGKLGEGLGLTFQQIQKYENGSNRISASRLQQIASILDVPVSFFFDSSTAPALQGGGWSGMESTSQVLSFLGTKEGLQLTKAFMRIKDSRVRRRVVDLAEELAEQNQTHSERDNRS